MRMLIRCAVKCNLTELTTKRVCIPLRVCGIVLCTNAFAYVSIPWCPVVFFEALVLVHPAGVCAPLHFVVFVRASAPVHALS